MRFLTRWAALAAFGFVVLPLFAADDVKKPEPDKKVEKKDADAKDAPKVDAPKPDADAKDKKDEKKPDAKDGAKKDADVKDAPKKDAPKKDDAKDKKPDAKDKKDEKKDKDWIPAGKMAGELVNVDESKHIIKVKLTAEIRSINQGEAQALVQEQANYAKAIAARDANGARQAQQNMLTHERNLYKIDKKTTDVEVPVMEDVKIRIPTPGTIFDDDGKIKRPNAEELKKLKGPDPTLPGYPGEFNNLRTGQMVGITLVRKKDAKPMPVKVDPFTGKPPADLDLTGDSVPHASMIQIIAEGKN